MSNAPIESGPDLPRGSDALGRLYRLVRKELSEILRDRRTVITLVLMPLLLYPLLSIAFQQVAAASLLKPADEKRMGKGNIPGEDLPNYYLGVESEEQGEIVRKLLSVGERFGKPDIQRWELRLSENLEDDVQAGRVDAGIRVEQGKYPKKLARDMPVPEKIDDFLNQEIRLKVISLQGSPLSQNATEMIERRLLWFHQRMIEYRIKLDHNPYRPLVLAHMDHHVLKQPGDGTSISLPALVPLILILMTITGAVYPAIDTTAGERERGTLEMLVAAPVPRLGLLFAKYVTVVVVAVLTGVVNLVGMTVTLKFSGLESEVIKGGLSADVLIQVVALLLLFALFFAALLLSLTSFARSFKEAQAYLIPLMLVSLGPGIIGVIPGIKLEGILLVAPLVNIVLLGRDLFEGQMDPATAIIVVGITLVYAGAAIALAARVFGAESVLYSEQSGWSDLFRRPEEPQVTASVPSALWCLALMIPIHYVLQGTIQLILAARTEVIQENDSARIWQLVAIPVISIILFVGLPLLSAWLGRVQLGTGLALLPPSPVAVAAALILGFCLWPGMLWLLSFFVEKQAVPESLVVGIRQMRNEFPMLMLLTVIVPAAVEELFFRGFLFSALQRLVRPLPTILATAGLFALLHVVMGGALGPARFWPSLAMGLLLGWVRTSSGSVVPGLLLHMFFNASLELAAQHSDLLAQYGMNVEDMGMQWVLGSALALVWGNALLYWTWQRSRKQWIAS